MNRPSFIFLIALLLAWPVSAQQKFEPTSASYQKALVGGQVGEYAVAMEAVGSRAKMEQDWAKASSAYTAAANATIRIGQLQKAMSLAVTAVELALKAKDPSIESSAMLRLADIYGRVGQPQEERVWLEKARVALERIEAGVNKDLRMARLYMQLGQHCARQGEIDQAITYISQSVALGNAGVNYLRSPAGAHTSKLQSRIARAESQIADSLDRLGRAYLQAGNTEEAINAAARGLGVLQAAGLKTGRQASLLRSLGGAYLQLKDFGRALESYVKALQMAEERHQTGNIRGASIGIGDVLVKTGSPSEAVTYYKKAVDTVESTRSLFESGEFRASFFDTNGRSGPYIGIINAYLEPRNAKQAFNYNERARSRAFLDILGTKVRLSKAEGGLRDEEEILKAKINPNVTAEREEAGTAGGFPSAGNKKLEDEYNAFVTKAKREHREQASLMNVEPLRLKEVQALLEPGQTLIEYFVAPEKTFVWVVERDHLAAVIVSVAQNDLEQKVDALRKSIAELKPLREYQSLAREMHKLLIHPVLPQIKGKELIIIPHGVLHYLPFQALYSSGGRYLVEDYSIGYLSSASLLQFTKEKRKGRGDKVLVVGSPDLGDPRKDLKSAELEAAEIKRLYPLSRVLLGQAATKNKAKELSTQYNILHFAAHAELKPDDPLSSAVLLAKDSAGEGRLEVKEVFEMDIKAGLVVLSGCETGLGKLSSGDEFIGLTRAFIYAGTPSVVASLWKVDDSSTALLMSSFYRNLKTKSKVEALRQAQLEMIRGEMKNELLAQRGVGGVGKLGETPTSQSLSQNSISVSTSHPYFWAPFILVGDGK